MNTIEQLAESAITALTRAGFTRAGVSRAKGLAAAKAALSTACMEIEISLWAVPDTHLHAAFGFVFYRKSIRSWADMEVAVVDLLNRLELVRGRRGSCAKQ